MTDYTKPPVIPAWAEAGDRSDVPSTAEIQEGWPLSNTPPTRQRFNWILNWLANAVRYWMQKGIADWDAAESYQEGGIIQDNTGQTWQAIRDNTNAPPATSPLDWVKWPNTSAIEADVANAVSTANAASASATAANTAAGNAQTTANAALPKAGGIMTGPITLPADGTGSQAARYSQVAAMVKLAYANKTGFLNLRGAFTTSFAASSISFDAAILKNATGETLAIGATSFAAIGSAVGAPGGTDGYTLAASTWNYLYIICGPGKTVSTVFSLSDVAPNLTGAAFAGYTFYAIAAPVRLGGDGSIVQCRVIGDIMRYRGMSANALSGFIVTGNTTNNTPFSLANVPTYVPPKALEWQPYGSILAFAGVSGSSGFGSYDYNVRISYTNGAPIPDMADYQSGNQQIATSVRIAIPPLMIPYVSGQVPTITVQDATGSTGTLNMSVGEYRYPNGAV